MWWFIRLLALTSFGLASTTITLVSGSAYWDYNLRDRSRSYNITLEWIFTSRLSSGTSNELHVSNGWVGSRLGANSCRLKTRWGGYAVLTRTSFFLEFLDFWMLLIERRGPSTSSCVRPRSLPIVNETSGACCKASTLDSGNWGIVFPYSDAMVLRDLDKFLS
jgi:hypothetical protein